MNRRRILSAFVLTATLATGFIAGQASGAQPHMQSALAHLRQARTALNKATDDKGGHKARALVLVNDAIVQVEAGINYDKKH